MSRTRSWIATLTLVLVVTGAATTVGLAATLPPHRPLRILVVSDTVNGCAR